MRSSSTLGVSTALGVMAIAGCGRIGYEPLDIDREGGLVAPRDGAADALAADAADSGESDAPDGSDALRPVDGSEDGASSQGPDSGAQDARPDNGQGSSGGADASTRVVNLTDPAQTVRSGMAQINGSELDLTVNSRDNAGAAYLPQPYAIGPPTSFTLAASFRLYRAIEHTRDRLPLQ